jgi:dynein heavy chain, axonemal
LCYFTTYLYSTITRYNFLLERLVSHRRHMLFVGPTGTGKTVYVKRYLQQVMPQDKFNFMMMNFSAQTSANMTQDIIDGKLDKRKKGTFGPPPGKNMVIFVDDLNMPKVRYIVNIIFFLR